MSKSFTIWFNKIIDKVENTNAPLYTYFQFFFALLIVRITLEFFSNQKLFTVLDFIHIALWFILIVLAFLLQLQQFSKVEIVKVSKLVVTFFSISLTAPIIDMIFFKGKGVQMNYLSINNWQQLAYNFITIGGTNFKRGATIGIRIEILLLMVGCFKYINTKRDSLFLALIGTFSIYTFLFFCGTIPFLLNLLTHFLQLKKSESDQSSILLLLFLDSIIFIYLIYKYKPILFTANSVSWIYILLATVYFAIGAVSARTVFPDNWELNSTTFFYFPIFFVMGFYLFLLYRTLSLSSTIKNKHNFLSVKYTLLIVLAGLCYCISYKTLFAFLLSWSILYLLFEQPLNLFKIPFLQVILNSCYFTSMVCIGYCSFGGALVTIPILLLSGIFSINLIVHFLYNKFHTRLL